MIDATDIRYDYAQGPALDGAALTAPTGEITALVGPNGAGKTTLMRILAGLMRPHGGRAMVGGVDVAEDPRSVHAMVGFLPDFIGLYDELSAERHLRHAGAAAGLSDAETRIRAQEIAERLDIAELLPRKAEEMSRGQRQRLAIAQALMKRPKLLILDEPASGLDPDARMQLSKLLRELKADGATLLVSSHILAELEDYSDRVAVMRDGRVARIERLGETETGRDVVSVTLARPVSGLAAAIAAAAPTAEVLAAEGATAEIQVAADAAARAEILAALVQAGLPVAGFAVKKRRLEDAYFDAAKSGAGLETRA